MPPKAATVPVAPAGRMPPVPLVVSATAPVVSPVPLVTETGSTSVPWCVLPNVSV